MTESINFRAPFPQIDLLQRTYCTKSYVNFHGRQHRILTLARLQNRNWQRDGSSITGSAQNENTTPSSNTLLNNRPSTSALLGKRRERPHQGRRQNNNGGYSSDEDSSSAAEDSPLNKNKFLPPAPAPFGRSKIKLDPSAHDISWDACTVRGFEDGSLVFKFDQLDPRIEEDLSPLSFPSTTTTTTATANNTYSSTSPSINSLSNPSTTSTLANFAWSNAVKLGVKFPQQFEITLRKLEDYLIEFNGKTAPVKLELKHSLFKTYEKAVRRQEKIRLNEGIVAGIEAMLSKEDENELEEGLGEGGKSGEIRGNEGSESEETLDAAAIEELRSSIIKNGSISSTKAAFCIEKGQEGKEEEGQQGTVAFDNDDTTRSSFSTVNSLYDILKAFYRTVVLTPIVFFISTISSIITWAVHLPFRLYRSLPYNFRKLFHRYSWPPKIVNRHASPAIHALFIDTSGFNRSSLADAGFDAQGRCAAPLTPLADIPAWKLEQLVDCGISNADLYRSALTHPTALPPEARALSYERLEYLGDAVLELCTRQLLMARAPEADEGELTNQGQFLVAGSTVNKYGSWMGLDKWLLCNAYSMRGGLIGSPHILGDAFEALLAAVYIDRGLEAARKLLIRVFNECPSVEWAKIGFMRDHKGELMKVAHQRRKPLPMYTVVSARHALYKDDNGHCTTGIKKKYWTVEVEFDGEVIGSGSNFEKREAEREAARAALVYLGELNESDDEGEEEKEKGRQFSDGAAAE